MTTTVSRSSIIFRFRLDIRSLRLRLFLCFVAAGIQASATDQSSKVLAAADSSWKSFYAQASIAQGNQDFVKAEELYRKALNASHSNGSTAESEKCMLKLADILTLRDKAPEAETIYENC